MYIVYNSMGNKNNKPHSSNQCLHPRLGNVSRIQEEGKEAYLVYDLVLESQKLYESWLQQLKTIQKIEQDILFLPLEHKYEQTNFCGTGGFAVVPPSLSSSNTKTTSTPWSPRSPIAKI